MEINREITSLSFSGSTALAVSLYVFQSHTQLVELLGRAISKAATDILQHKHRINTKQTSMP
jgi:hypothetical protein